MRQRAYIEICSTREAGKYEYLKTVKRSNTTSTTVQFQQNYSACMG